MIVKMKKIIILVQSKDVESALTELGKAGLLHIEHQTLPMSDSIKTLQERYLSLLTAIEALPVAATKKALSKDPEELIREIHGLVDKKEAILENLKKINRDIEEWKEWGDFDPGLIDDLKHKGIFVQLCRRTKKQMKDVPDGVILERLFKKGNIYYCAVISRKEIELPFETLPLPCKGGGQMVDERDREMGRIACIDKRLSEIAEYKDMFILYKRRMESLLEFNRAREGMGRFEGISYVKGYCPVYRVNSLEILAGKERWGIVIEDPDASDNVPTLIKNPRWIDIIRPVFQMIKTIPGYREVDISFWFLFFFSVFFGMLIGDAGYGLVFFLINLFCHTKFKDRVRDKSIFFLMYVLSLSAIAWGVLTGTFFGQAPIDKFYLTGPAWLPQRVGPLLPFLRENRNVQALCFFIGAAHLSIAHLWRFIRKMPSVKAFSEAGWICILWVAYFLARALILGDAFPKEGKWLFASGATLVILCTNPSKNIFKTLGSGIGGFLLNIVNSFTDTVSYIRLFAVGTATVAVADAFNQMASGIGGSGIMAGFLTAFILLFGHTLNILLGAMAVLVHGVRLNVLEFSSHLNMEWSGIEYRPFKEEGD